LLHGADNGALFTDRVCPMPFFFLHLPAQAIALTFVPALKALA